MKTGIIIVAGGTGSRMGTQMPKQFLPLAGKPLLMHTIDRLAQALPQATLAVVLPGEQLVHWAALCEQYGFETPHTVVPGGKTRFESVKNGLKAVAGCRTIGVHDGVRPLVGKELILRVWQASLEARAAIPVIPVTDSLREIPVNRPVDRNHYVAVQTPQFFHGPLLVEAYERQDAGFTDDASVVEASGTAVTLVPGDPANIKITTPVDLAVAETLLSRLSGQAR